MVGAKGFEPSTSWSRTKYQNPINVLIGVAYGTRNVVSPLSVVRKLSVAQRLEALSIRSKTECSDSLFGAEEAGGLLIFPALFVHSSIGVFSMT